MKFRYYIIDEWDAVWGTNDKAIALKAAETASAVVVDAAAGEAIDIDGAREDIDEYEADNSSGDLDLEDDE